MDTNKIYLGDCLEILKTFPDESINCCVTSPPYWALRNYQTEPTIWDGNENCKHEWNQIQKTLTHKSGETNPGKEGWYKDKGASDDKGSCFCCKCGAWRGSLGLEPDFRFYIKHLCDIFDEVKRVLRKDGTCWVVIGNTYATHTGKRTAQFGGDIQDDRNNIFMKNRPKQAAPEKSLCQIPARFAIAMADNNDMDILELDKDWIISYIMDNTNNPTGDQDAIQRQGQSEGIQHRVQTEVERGTQRTTQKNDGGMANKESPKSKTIQQDLLLVTQGAGNSTNNEGKCKISSTKKNRCPDVLWWETTPMCLLWGNETAVSDNTSHTQQRSATQERNQKIWVNLSVVKEHELSRRFQCFVHELQLGNRKIRILPPSGRRNICIRRREIPKKLRPLFKLYKEERWLLRNEIIWHKPNCLPSSAKDRFTVDFEYIFFFVKNKKYWFETQREPHTQIDRRGNNRIKYQDRPDDVDGGGTFLGQNPQGRNKRCVWTISTKSFPDAHFAVFPSELIIDCIKAGCPENGIVLDPFFGSGTTGEVALRLGRKFIGIELNEEYIRMAEKRLNKFLQSRLFKNN